jgi:lipopolysaccharide export system protein LptA
MYRLLKYLVFLFLPLSVYALPEDRDQAMNIVADASLFNYKTGINTYEGNVKIDQGTTHLLADRLTTKSDTRHKMIEATAYGIKKIAEYTTLPKKGDLPLHAKANIIRFFPPKATVILEGNVVVTQGENSFHGPVIIYNMKDQIVTAPASQNGHATIIIEPNQTS